MCMWLQAWNLHKSVLLQYGYVSNYKQNLLLHRNLSTFRIYYFDYFGYTIQYVYIFIHICSLVSSLSCFGWFSHRAGDRLSHSLILCPLNCCRLVTLWSLMFAGCSFLLRVCWNLSIITHSCITLSPGDDNN